MMRVCLLLLALVAAAHADCLATGLATYFANNGISSDLLQVQAATQTTVAKLPICASAYTKGADGQYTTCCDAASFVAIKNFGEAYSQAIAQVTAAAEAIKTNSLNNVNLNQIPAQYRQLVDNIIADLKSFIKNFFPDYAQCLAGYRDYVEGVLCSLCRPDFFPAIGNIDTTTNVLTLTFSQNSCNTLVDKCTPAINDLRDFVISFLTNIQQWVPTGLNTTANSDFLAAVPGATTADKIKTWVCQDRAVGISTVDFLNIAQAIAAATSNIPQVKREDVMAIHGAVASVSRRQAAGQAIAYVLDPAAYNPIVVGQTQNFIASASGVVVSVALVAAAAFGVLLF
jgi:hypothetical protein